VYGWRARIGIIYPASGLADHEYFLMAPRGVSVHVTRSSVPDDGGVTLENVQDVAEGRELVKLARDLATVRPTCIAWMCTSGSFGRGAEWDDHLVATLERASGARATTTSASLVAAVRALGVRCLSCATPYEPRVDQKLREYLEGRGLTVARIRGLGLTRDWEIGSLPPERAYALAVEVDDPAAEAIFISDTGFRALEYIELMEADLGKPVMSANTVTMWHALRLSGVREPLPGYGRLFRMPLPGGGSEGSLQPQTGTGR
jgi:maleate isomerase